VFVPSVTPLAASWRGHCGLECATSTTLTSTVTQGAFAEAEKKFDAPIQRVLSYVLNKALKRVPPRRPTEETWAK
jgi:hypothetical protein